MAFTVREAFEKGTETFNAHDLDGFAAVMADDVVFQAPGGMSGTGKAACVEFFGSWFGAFPDAHVQVHGVTFSLHGPMGDVPPTGRTVAVDYIQVLRFRDGLHVGFHLSFDRLLEQLGLLPHRHPQIAQPHCRLPESSQAN